MPKKMLMFPSAFQFFYLFNYSIIILFSSTRLSDKLIIRMYVPFESFEVINLLGEKVFTESSNKITTSSLSKGTYILMINLSDSRVLENKIIIE